MRNNLRNIAGALGLAIVMMVSPTAASADTDTGIFSQPIGYECSTDATSVLVLFDAKDITKWYVLQGGNNLSYGETDKAPDDRYVLVLDIEPGVPVTAVVNADSSTFTCEAGTLDFTWEWGMESGDVFDDKVQSPITARGWGAGLRPQAS